MFAPVIISAKGTFKYILIHIFSRPRTYVIRGDVHLGQHAANFQAFVEEMKRDGWTINHYSRPQGVVKAQKNGQRIEAKCLGGGRIIHNDNNRRCFIYGYSKTYGRVDHEIAKKLIAQSLKYPLEEIQTSPDGY